MNAGYADLTQSFGNTSCKYLPLIIWGFHHLRFFSRFLQVLLAILKPSLPMVKNICLLNLVNAYDALWLASL